MTWWRQRRTYIIFIALTICIIGGAMGGILFYQAQLRAKEVPEAEAKLMKTSQHSPVSYSPILEWAKDINIL